MAAGRLTPHFDRFVSVGCFRIFGMMAAYAEDHRSMPPHDGRECLLVARADEAVEEVRVGAPGVRDLREASVLQDLDDGVVHGGPGGVRGLYQ